MLTVPTSPDRIRADVHREWNDPARLAAWRRRHPDLSSQSRAATDLVVAAAGIAPGIAPGMRVLDIAGGNGEPALVIARLVAPVGRVSVLDCSAPMLADARERARELGITAIDFVRSDAETLPFADATFDAVTCRFGIMYFWDPARALAEARRVLRLGGRAAFVVWGPPEGSSIFVNRAVAGQYGALPASDPARPQRLRFARPGSLAAALRRAGFAEVDEYLQHVPWPTRGTPEEVAEGIPFRDLVEALPPTQRERAAAEVLAVTRRLYDPAGGVVSFIATLSVVTGTR